FREMNYSLCRNLFCCLCFPMASFLMDIWDHSTKVTYIPSMYANSCIFTGLNPPLMVTQVNLDIIPSMTLLLSNSCWIFSVLWRNRFHRLRLRPRRLMQMDQRTRCMALREICCKIVLES